MVSESIQPLHSIGPMNGDEDRRKEDLKDPAKRDYIEGLEHYKAERYSEAALAFHNSMKGFEEQGYDQGVANAADRLGDCCLAREEYEMALTNYQRSLEICEEMEDSFSILALHKKMAFSYRKKGDLDKALELLFDMIEQYHVTRNPQGVVDTLIATAEVYLKQGKNDKAADTFRTVSSIHGSFKHKRLSEEFARKAEELEQA